MRNQPLQPRACSYAKKYQAKYPPKCGCKTCWDKWFMSHQGEIAGIHKVLKEFGERGARSIIAVRGDKYYKQAKRFLEEHPVLDVNGNPFITNSGQ
jgi:hypothetical protein